MSSFFQRVYQVVKEIPRGKVATYGQIAELLNAPNSSRAVGYALHANPDQAHIPCHRVVNRFGEVSRAFAFGGINEQRRLLESEGVKFESDGRINLNQFQWKVFE